MKHDIPEPNMWRRQWLVSAEARAIVTERTNTALMVYQAGVAKRSTALARSARTTVGIGGTTTKYWVGELVIGDTGVAADYVLPHEFGAKLRYDANRGDPSFDEREGDRDLNATLLALAWIPL